METILSAIGAIGHWPALFQCTLGTTLASLWLVLAAAVSSSRQRRERVNEKGGGDDGE